MSSGTIQTISARLVFQPRAKFALYASEHVSLDDLTTTTNYEARALDAVTNESICVAVIGPIGGGKSSLIASVCNSLPDEFIALRVPIAGVDDPTSTSAMAAMTLATALHSIELESEQRGALELARADETSVASRARTFGGKLGGGPVPAEVSAELDTLRTQQETRALAGDRLAGLDRLVSILAAQGRQPVFVLEDTEAAVGGSDRDDVIERFFAGPISTLMRELDASFLLAVQDNIAEHSAFRRLAPSMVRVNLPHFEPAEAIVALTRILTRRLQLYDRSLRFEETLDGGALKLLAEYYCETGSVRHSLAAAQGAADHAAEDGASCIVPGHIRAAVSEWRSR
jgi:hypothetical protein